MSNCLVRCHSEETKAKMRKPHGPNPKISLALKGKPKSVEHRVNISRAKRGKPNPRGALAQKGRTHRPEVLEHFRSREYREAQRQRVRQIIRENPDKIFGAIVNGKRTSKGQLRLLTLVQEFHPEAQLNLGVETTESYRFIDVAVPSRMEAWEFDGGAHYFAGDDQRDRELQALGWSVIHVTEPVLRELIARQEEVSRE